MTLPAPFVRDAFVAKPGIVGALWWQASVQAPVGRRVALAMALGGAGIVGAGAIFLLASGPSPSEEVKTLTKGSLEMQREYGWSFGAADETTAASTGPLLTPDLTLLTNLPEHLRPLQPRHQPYYVPTLFQAPAALPKSLPVGDAVAPKPLTDVVRPIASPSMRTSYQQGKALSSLFDSVGADTAIIVDLPGVDAVAFAAGAATAFEPIFLFDNWPHPRGVVASHQTLAAALTYGKTLTSAAAGRLARPSKPSAMFVLDRQRLATYTDEATQFDNRYVAKVPDATKLKAMGYKSVIYVVPKDGDAELDDLNEDFVAYQQASIPVRILALTTFLPNPAVPPRDFAANQPFDDGITYAYGGSDATHTWFWTDYGLGRSPRPGSRAPTFTNTGKTFTPTPRRTAFSSGTTATTSPGARPRPSGFGLTPVVVGVATGVILGSRLSRSGSWNRSGGSAFG